MRCLERLVITRNGDFLNIEVQANGFLYHMVRNIVGALVKVGAGNADPDWMERLLAGRDRRLAAPTARRRACICLKSITLHYGSCPNLRHLCFGVFVDPELIMIAI